MRPYRRAPEEGRAVTASGRPEPEEAGRAATAGLPRLHFGDSEGVDPVAAETQNVTNTGKAACHGFWKGGSGKGRCDSRLKVSVPTPLPFFAGRS
jgi:hypothetical protein